MIRIRVITKFVPAICIVSGLIAVFIAKADFGWVFVGGGVLIQILFLFSSRRQGS